MDREALATACKELALFPLPGVVLMPGSVLPLHVFEPRYRQLVEHCLEGRPLCVPQLREDSDGESPPSFLPYSSIGVIGAHRKRPDGRYDILVQPLARVRLIGERPSEALYRVAEAELLEDLPVDEREMDQVGERIYNLFGMLVSGNESATRGLAQIPLARMAEALAGYVIDEQGERQRFLAEDDPLRRALFVEAAVLSLFSSRMPAAES